MAIQTKVTADISYHLRGSLVQKSKDVHFEFDCAILLKDGSILQINKNERICLDKEKTGDFELFILRKNVTKTCLNVFLFEDMRFRCRLWKTDEKVMKPVTFFARSVVGVKEENFYWDIKRFSSLRSGDRVAYVVRIEKIDFGPCTSNRVFKQMDKLVDLKEDLKCLYGEGVFSDVKLRTATQVFQAHKILLSARSPIFRAMFNTNMKEKIQKCVDIQDLEDDTVRRMLMYVYTNEVEGLQWESALKLHFAADKYQIVGLKNECSFLKRNMCPSTVCDLLVLADLHGDGELKTTAQDYALTHGKEIFQSDEWRLFAEHNSTLAIETILLKFKKH
ncbi:TD and POZ domain-containing protein 3 [Trichonephila clavipes]|uniref:TD and POZ domain-containing protein 3 n=1 Tax=Trichonephila clavipes TaxID=2585209 RepID=A0A8X6SF22_TRICX|nr:TD and POZ domain-containing protein 3 [Trichonephila clavipes]